MLCNATAFVEFVCFAVRRDFTSEDYERLLALDESTPKLKSASSTQLFQLEAQPFKGRMLLYMFRRVDRVQ